ncbi:MAG: hypothetical protein A2Y10_11015 [Planctomycetes bacterium GWF2_41_51]|nr:MAG: hypothetical protein A2Y10_11015 [Planctomycetes bacterium GWF2_41_51]
MVISPPDAPSWWNAEGTLYAYGYWEANITGGEAIISPPADSDHWASNYLENDDFEASIGFSDQTIKIELGNLFRQDLYKQIYVYITGTTTSTINNVEDIVDTDGGIFYGEQTWNITENGEWTYVLEGEIHPQPAFANIWFNVPGMTSVTNIWAGENCIPEPTTICMLGLGVLSLIRRKKLA